MPPWLGIASAHSGGGHWLSQTKGRSFHSGDAPGPGTLTSLPLNAPVVNEGD